MLPNESGLLVAETDTPTRLDPRVKRTRQLLVDAFVALSLEKDFSSITVQDITDRATVNRATFYAHFEDKYALLNYYVRESFGAKIKHGMSHECAFSVANLRTLVEVTCDYMAETHAGCRQPDLQHVPQLRMQMQDQLYTLMLRWVKALPARLSGHAAPHPVAPEVLAGTLSWMVFGAAIQWVMEGRTRPKAEVARHVVELMMGGLASYVDLRAEMVEA